MSKEVEFLLRATDNPLPQFLAIQSPHRWDDPKRDPVAVNPQFELILSGSFNPLHAGHLAMAQFASDLYSAPCWFELTLANADKGLISPAAMNARLRQDFCGHGVILSTASRFCDKSHLFPGTVFVVGADTIVRLADPKYYFDSEKEMVDSFARISHQACRFLVFGRKIDGQFKNGMELDLPRELYNLCRFVAPTDFALDISSTDLRAERNSESFRQ